MKYLKIITKINKAMITELKPTNLIAVEVPLDSKDTFSGINENIWNSNISLPKGEYKILGEVTKDKIGFDVEPYVDKYNNGAYRDYKDGYPFYPDFDTPNICLNNEESFRSLLAANGLYFENPVKVSGKHIVGTINKLAQEWQSFEDKLITGKLLILEKL